MNEQISLSDQSDNVPSNLVNESISCAKPKPIKIAKKRSSINIQTKLAIIDHLQKFPGETISNVAKNLT